MREREGRRVSGGRKGGREGGERGRKERGGKGGRDKGEAMGEGRQWTESKKGREERTGERMVGKEKGG